MLLKLFLLKLFLRVEKLSKYLNLFCQITFICLNILVETDDSGGGKNETDQEDSVEEFCDLDDGGEIDDVALSAMPKSQQNMFKCSQCENCFISLTYLSQHKNSLHLKIEEDCSKENEQVNVDDKLINQKSAEFVHSEHEFENVVSEVDSKLQLDSTTKEDFENKPPHKRFKKETQHLFPCSQCGNIFKTLKILSKHKNENHLKIKKEQSQNSKKNGNSKQVKRNRKPQPKNKKCKECEATFHSNQNLKDHIVVRHSGIYPHLCDICGKGFTVKEFYQRFEDHRKKCSANGPKVILEKVCKECDKSFTTMSRYKRHMIFHTKAKEFQCSDCDKNICRQKKFNEACSATSPTEY